MRRGRAPRDQKKEDKERVEQEALRTMAERRRRTCESFIENMRAKRISYKELTYATIFLLKYLPYAYTNPLVIGPRTITNGYSQDKIADRAAARFIRDKLIFGNPILYPIEHLECENDQVISPNFFSETKCEFVKDRDMDTRLPRHIHEITQHARPTLEDVSAITALWKDYSVFKTKECLQNPNSWINEDYIDFDEIEQSIRLYMAKERISLDCLFSSAVSSVRYLKQSNSSLHTGHFIKAMERNINWYFEEGGNKGRQWGTESPLSAFEVWFSHEFGVTATTHFEDVPGLVSHAILNAGGALDNLKEERMNALLQRFSGIINDAKSNNLYREFSVKASKVLEMETVLSRQDAPIVFIDDPFDPLESDLNPF